MVPPLPTLSPELAALLRTAGIFLGAVALFFALRALLFRQLHRWSQRTHTAIDDVVVHAMSSPTLFWCVALALDTTVRTSTLTPDVRQVTSRALMVLLVLSITMTAANIAGGALTLLLRRQGDGSVSGLGQTVVRAIIVTLGFMVLLNALGVEIAPLITALGVGGLAVALALQDTLTNFFAGIHILLERPFHIGNFIELEDRRQGHVMDIGWRTTRIKTLQDDVVVVPNSKIAGSTIVNYHMPIPRSRVELEVGVSYDCDPERVRVILTDELRAAVAVESSILANPPPDALLVRFGASALEFRVRFYVDDISNQTRSLDVAHRRVFARLREEGIEIPFPTTTLHVRAPS